MLDIYWDDYIPVHDISFLLSSSYVQASFAPDGRYVTAGSTDGGIYVWDVDNGSTQSKLPCLILKNPGPSSPVSAVNWCSPQGEIVSADKGGVCTIWK